MKVNIFDSNFTGQKISVLGKDSENIEYVHKEMNWDGITIFVDDHGYDNVVKAVKSKIKILWLLEPRAIKPYIYDRIGEIIDLFDYVITHDDFVVQTYPDKAKFMPPGGCWIQEPQIYPKSKNCCIIASNKNWVIGHSLRHQIIKDHPDIEAVGSGYRKFEKKEEVTADYRFQIVIENSRVNGYFSEKILDCFACGTVPVYWGCKNIDQFFNVDGILVFKNFTEFVAAKAKMTEEYYNRPEVQRAIVENLKLVDTYGITEDWMYHNILKDLV